MLFDALTERRQHRPKLGQAVGLGGAEFDDLVDRRRDRELALRRHAKRRLAVTESERLLCRRLRAQAFVESRIVLGDGGLDLVELDFLSVLEILARREQVFDLQQPLAAFGVLDRRGGLDEIVQVSGHIGQVVREPLRCVVLRLLETLAALLEQSHGQQDVSRGSLVVLGLRDHCGWSSVSSISTRRNNDPMGTSSALHSNRKKSSEIWSASVILTRCCRE